MGSGPSLSREDVQRVRELDLRSIAINTIAIDYAPWSDFVYAADTAWWTKYYGCLVRSSCKITCNDSVQFADVHLLRNTGIKGFDPDSRCIRTGQNSGYQALHIALQTGASRVLLLGIDMTIEHGLHCHGPHPKGLSNPTEKYFQRCLTHWGDLRKAADSIGCEVINCSRFSKLECFPKMTLSQACG